MAAEPAGENPLDTSIMIDSSEIVALQGGGDVAREGVAGVDYSPLFEEFEGEPGRLRRVYILGISPELWRDVPAPIGDGILPSLGKFRNLKELHIDSCKDFDVSGLRTVGGLRSLGFERCPDVTGEEVGELPKIAPGLRHLDLKACRKLSGEIPEGLADLPHLRTLRVKKIALSEGDVENIQQLEGLRELHLTVSPAVMERFGGFRPSVDLYLDMNFMNHPRGIEIDLSRLAESESIVALTFYCATFEKGDLEVIASLPNLRELDLFSSEIGDEDLKVIGSMHCLERLDIRRCKLSDAAVAALERDLPDCEIRH